jgi:hypothetical protein
MQVPREVRSERAVQPGPAGQRERLHRGAVIRLRRGDHLPAIRVAALDVVAAGELDGHLVGVGAAGREARPGESLRRHVDQLPCETLLCRIRESLVVNVRQCFGLGAGGGDDVGAAMPERRGHRAAAHRIQISAAGAILDPHPVAANDDRHRATEL